MVVGFCWWDQLFGFKFMYAFISVVISVLFMHECEAV